MLITGHYWDPKFPKLFSLNQINEFKNLKIIGDITCDINGSIPTTIRSTSITKPYYSFDTNLMKEIDLCNKGIAVMAVDNLPSELPKESSEEFGNALTSNVLPYIINNDDGRIKKATIVKKGKLTAPFTYLKDFIK
jgi:alanine dehydrogenase